MDEDDRTREGPLWVKIGLAGLPDRSSAWAFFWVSVAVAAGCIAAGWFADPLFFIGGPMVFASLWYYACIRWVDRHGGWPERDA